MVGYLIHSVIRHIPHLHPMLLCRRKVNGIDTYAVAHYIF